ncbi:MAG: hypothetical protein JNL08_11900 [Planctomycetes bacterium]|nr:hypothetical protein [Planctomycetota bacterium]
MLRITLVVLALATSTLAQTPVAYFGFDANSLASTQPPFATVSPLVASRPTTYGGPVADRWLGLGPAWNTTGGTLSFTVTPAAGEAVRYEHLRWRSEAPAGALGDPIAGVVVHANGVLVGSIAPLPSGADHDLWLAGTASLKAQTAPVTFVFTFTGNPAGQGQHTIAHVTLQGTACDFAVQGAQPWRLPTVSTDSFLLYGPGLDTVTDVSFGPIELSPYTPGSFGAGAWELANPCTIFVHPPQCLAPGTYPIVVSSPCGTQTVQVTIVDPVVPVLAAETSHPAGQTQCFHLHAGGPGPQVLILMASPVLQPSVIPGLVDFGIGAGFTNFLSTFFIADCTGWCIPVPASRAGDTWHFQGAVWHSANLDLSQPLPTTAVVTVSWY